MYAHINWCSTTPVSYDLCKNILNPWNGNRPINISKEFQPVEDNAAL